MRDTMKRRRDGSMTRLFGKYPAGYPKRSSLHLSGTLQNEGVQMQMQMQMQMRGGMSMGFWPVRGKHGGLFP